MRFWLLSLLITFSTSTYASLGGSEAGNGTDDLKPDVGTAWFLGHDKKIRYCFELGANFPVARQDVSDILKQVFKQWFDYLEKTGVLALAEKSGTPFATAVSLVDCRENPDLKFLLGTDSPDSQSQKEFYQDPLAFAVRTEYRIETGWGKGFVWLAPEGSVEKNFPNWKDPYVLPSVLLHEIGHVLGCGHVPETIMDQYLAQALHTPKASLAQIDQRNRLVFNWTLPFEVHGVLGAIDYPGSAESRFETLTGKKPKGPISATLYNNPDSKKVILKVSSGKESREVDLTFQWESIPRNHSTFQRGYSLFRAYIANQTPFSYPNTGMVVYGAMKDARGIEHALAMEINSNTYEPDGPAIVKFFSEGEMKHLFRQTYE